MSQAKLRINLFFYLKIVVAYDISSGPLEKSIGKLFHFKQKWFTPTKSKGNGTKEKKHICIDKDTVKPLIMNTSPL
jgi:hypothetical protein